SLELSIVFFGNNSNSKVKTTYSPVGVSTEDKHEIAQDRNIDIGTRQRLYVIQLRSPEGTNTTAPKEKGTMIAEKLPMVFRMV
ncbi:hypothetical protein Tco_0075336, partial [Tanacetum coccineum]